MDKKGADKLISVYWFMILVIVAGGVVMMVNTFYGSPYDAREVEASILADKVANCIMVGGEMNSELSSVNGVLRPAFKDNFMDSCNLNFDVQSEFERPQYYLEVNFYSVTNIKRSVFDIVYGNSNWKEDCNFEKPDQEKLAKCVQKKFYVADETNKLYLVEVLTIVGKTLENVK